MEPGTVRTMAAASMGGEKRGREVLLSMEGEGEDTKSRGQNYYLIRGLK